MSVVSNLPVNRSVAIAAAMHDAVKIALDAKKGADAAREASTDAAGAAGSAREVLMSTFADLSIAGTWMVPEIDAATAALASSLENEPKAQKSLATMLSEVKLAAYPNVRANFAALKLVRDECWAEEILAKEIAKKAGASFTGLLASVFSRQYQTLVAMCRAINKVNPSERPSTDITTAPGFMAWARTQDPARNPTKLAEKIAGHRDALNELLGAIGEHVHLRAVVDALAYVTATDISAVMFPVTDTVSGPSMVPMTKAEVREEEAKERAADKAEAKAEAEANVTYPNAPPAPVVTSPKKKKVSKRVAAAIAVVDARPEADTGANAGMALDLLDDAA